MWYDPTYNRGSEKRLISSGFESNVIITVPRTIHIGHYYVQLIATLSEERLAAHPRAPRGLLMSSWRLDWVTTKECAGRESRESRALDPNSVAGAVIAATWEATRVEGRIERT